MNYKCKCGEEIPEKRVDFLKKYNKKITCLNCSTEEKVVALQVNATKETRTIYIVSKETSDRMFKTTKQNGVNYGIRK